MVKLPARFRIYKNKTQKLHIKPLMKITNQQQPLT